MKPIIFQKLNFSYIYFVLYFIVCLVLEFFGLYFKRKYKSDYKTIGHFYEVLNLFLTSLSDFLSIIPLKIKKYLSGSRKKTEIDLQGDDTSSGRSSTFIFHNKLEDEKKRKMRTLNFYTFLTAGLDFLVAVLLFLNDLCFKVTPFQNFDEFFNSDLVIQIVLQYLLSICILKTHFYKHHYLSIIINIIAFLILFILDIADDDFDFTLDLAYFGVLLLIVLENAYGKKAMIFGYISPYTLLLLIGIYKNILIVIFLIFFVPIMLSVEDNFFGNIKDFDKTKALILLGNFFFTFFKNLFNWILIDIFSPSHLALSLIFANISFSIINMIIYNSDDTFRIKDKFQISIRIILYIILFVAAMIHNEIFIITKWGLADSTKLFLEEKVKEERLLSDFDLDKQILKRFDTMVELELEEEYEEDDNDKNNTDEKNNKEDKENKENNSD